MEVHNSVETERFRSGGAEYQVRRGVKGLITSADGVLLLEERHSDGEPFWTLPGGGIEGSEDCRRALRRELREELQCHAVVGAPVGSFPYAHVSRPNTISRYRVFECALLDEPDPNVCEGIHRYRWAAPDDPPAHTLPQVRAVLDTTARAPEPSTAAPAQYSVPE